MSRTILLVALVAATVGAAWLRLVDLGNRPMHTDEAVHAIKFGDLLENGHYRYDPDEYHGPGLNYLTLPITGAAGASKLADVTEVHLRLLPAIFGIGLVAAVWLLRRDLGPLATACAAALTAISPAMVFYSRYYIQEMLLVCFTFLAAATLWRAARSPDGPRRPVRRIGWLTLAGLCLGMMHVAKETFVIAAVAMIAAAGAVWVWNRGDRGPRRSGAEGSAGADGPWLRLMSLPLKAGWALLSACVNGLRGYEPASAHRMRPLLKCFVLAVGKVLVAAVRASEKSLRFAVVLVLIIAVAVSALFHSSFFDNPQGVVDSVLTYGHYITRAPGEGTGGSHDYPWHEYLRRLLWWQEERGLVWSEAAIVALALLGAAAAVTGKGLGETCRTVARFLAVYTLVLAAVYAAIPYKTPWCMLGFLHGLILLAGIGAAAALRAAPCAISKAVVAAVLLAAASHLGYQAWRGSFPACEDPTNPYVYAHTTSDARLLADQIRAIAAAGAEGMATPVQVIASDGDVWPLPWYLRDMPRAGYPLTVPSASEVIAPIVVIQPHLEDALTHRIYNVPPAGQQHAYVPIPLPPDDEDYDWVPMLRPNVPLRAFVRLDLWQTYMETKDPPPETEDRGGN